MQFERFFFLSQLILVLIYISPNEAISKNIYTDIEKPDTTLSATPYWKVVEAEYGEKKCEYIGGKIIHEYKDVFVVFSPNGIVKILYTLYKFHPQGRYDYNTLKSRDTFDSIDLTYHCEEFSGNGNIHITKYANNKIKVKFTNSYDIKVCYTLVSALQTDIDEWNNAHSQYIFSAEYKRQLKTLNMDILDYVPLTNTLLIEAIIRENGLDRELALRSYNMNIQRDLSFQPQLVAAVASPPTNPMDVMRAEIFENKNNKKLKTK